MYYEDYVPGERFEGAPEALTEAEIIAFGRRFDPQPFHVDPQAARGSIYGGLIASGWHVFSAAFGQAVRLGIFEGGGQGAPGIDEASWRLPVRPGDAIRVVVHILDKRLSRTRTDRGYVRVRFEVRNQREETVGEFTCREIVLLRESPPAAPPTPGTPG